MASIEKRSNNTYRITVSAGYDNKGKKIRKHKTITLDESLTERQREKELKKQAVLFEQAVESGTYLDGEKITFEEFINKWIVDYAEKQLALSTLNPYKMRLEKRIIPVLGHIKLSKLQPHHLLEFYNNLAEDGIRLDTYYKPNELLLSIIKNTKGTDLGISAKTHIRVRNGEKTSTEVAYKICNYFGKDIKQLFILENKKSRLSDKTIKHHHDLISTVLATAVEWNLITSNPADRVKPPKVTKKKSVYFDDKQIMNLFSLLDNEPLKYKVVFYLTIDTGLRLSELAGLEWNDLDFKNNILEINKQRQYVSGYGTLIKEPKTESGNRYVSISDTVISLLKKFKLHQKENRLKLGNLWIESNNIFIHEDGKPMHPHRPYRWFTDFLDKNNLPKATFHSLRHTNASLLIAKGIDVVTLSSRLGHSDKNTTLNTYSHIIKSKEKQASNIMEQFYNSNLELNIENAK